MLSNIYFDILLISKSLVTSKVFNSEFFLNLLFGYVLMFCVMANFQSCCNGNGVKTISKLCQLVNCL